MGIGRSTYKAAAAQTVAKDTPSTANTKLIFFKTLPVRLMKLETILSDRALCHNGLTVSHLALLSLRMSDRWGYTAYPAENRFSRVSLMRLSHVFRSTPFGWVTAACLLTMASAGRGFGQSANQIVVFNEPQFPSSDSTSPSPSQLKAAIP